MLWSEIGSSPHIEHAGMDGSRRKVVVNHSLSWPAGLAYDFVDSRIFWADEKLRCIGSATLDGDDIKVILKVPVGSHLTCSSMVPPPEGGNFEPPGGGTREL